MTQGTGDEKIRLIELFAGVGAFSAAFRNLKIPYETIAIAEIDPHALRAYASIHGIAPNLGDISLVETLPDCDLLTYSFPCQDLSIAGKRRGMSKGSDTRSGLLWEVERLLLDAQERERDGQSHLPKYLLMENVDAILHKTNISVFESWIQSLTKMGYTSSYAILNACDYGVPQHRKRCFMVSALGHDQLVFPQPCPDGRRLEDVLEEDVSEKYYLSEKALAGLKAHKARHNAGSRAELMHVANLETSYEQAGRVYSAKGLSPTINTCCEPKILTGACIRRLTPLECWRLQGFRDDDYWSAVGAGVSPTQLYRQAGNSIAVPVVEHILRAMYIDKTWQ